MISLCTKTRPSWKAGSLPLTQDAVPDIPHYVFSHIGTLNSSFAFVPHLFERSCFFACMHPLMSLSVIPRSCLCTRPRHTIRMNPESYPTWSLLSHTPLPPPRGISHIDICPFLSQGLPQATIAVQFDCRTRLAGLFFPPVSDAHRGNEAPGKMRGYLAHFGTEAIVDVGHSENRDVHRGAPHSDTRPGLAL